MLLQGFVHSGIFAGESAIRTTQSAPAESQSDCNGRCRCHRRNYEMIFLKKSPVSFRESSSADSFCSVPIWKADWIYSFRSP